MCFIEGLHLILLDNATLFKWVNEFLENENVGVQILILMFKLFFCLMNVKIFVGLLLVCCILWISVLIFSGRCFGLKVTVF